MVGGMLVLLCYTNDNPESLMLNTGLIACSMLQRVCEPLNTSVLIMMQYLQYSSKQ